MQPSQLYYKSQMITYRYVLRERNLEHHKIAQCSSTLFHVAKKHLLMFIAYTISQVIRSWLQLSTSIILPNAITHRNQGIQDIKQLKKLLWLPRQTHAYDYVIKMNRTTRMITCYTCLKLISFFKSKPSKNCFWIHHVQLTDWT